MVSGLLAALCLSVLPLPAARAQYAKAQSALAEVSTQVTAQQAALDALSAKIAADKAKQSGQPALFVPGRLQQELAQSQSLADALSQRRADQGADAAAVEAARAALYQSLSGEIARGKARPAPTAANLSALQALEAERDRVAPREAAPDPAPRFGQPTDDPRTLRERADALRDQADKLGKQEVALGARIQSARDQAQLQQQLSRLSGDDALFDESDRKVRVTRVDVPAAALASGNATPTPDRGTPTTGGATASALPAAQGITGQGVQLNGAQMAVGGPSGVDAMPTASAAPTAQVSAPSGAAPAAAEVNAVRTGERVNPDGLGRAAGIDDDDDASLAALLRAKADVARERSALEAQAKALDARAGPR